MFLGRIGRAESQFGSNLGPGRWRAGALNAALDQLQNLLLTRSQPGIGFGKQRHG